MIPLHKSFGMAERLQHEIRSGGKNMLKIAVVGTGIIGRSHLQAIAGSQQSSLCAVCDVNEEAARAYSEEYQVPYFTDYKEIPENTDAEAVILNLPHWLHCPVTEYFLEKGLHVLVEKPMANSVEECDRMITAAQKSGKKLAVGHIQRFFKANRKVKEIVGSGELGKLCMYTEQRTVDYFQESRPKWFLDKKKAGGGIIMNYGAHALDKLFYVTGYEQAEITSVVGNVKNDASVEGHAQILMQFPEGISASVTFSGYSNNGYEAVYYFTNGALKVTGSTILTINRGKGWEETEINGGEDSFLHQLNEFCKYVKGEPSEVATAEYSRAVIEAIEKIYRNS